MFGFEQSSFLSLSSREATDVCRFSPREDSHTATTDDDTLAFCSDFCSDASSHASVASDDFLFLQRLHQPSPACSEKDPFSNIQEQYLSTLFDKIRSNQIDDMKSYIDALLTEESITRIRTIPEVQEIYRRCIDLLIDDGDDIPHLTAAMRIFSPLVHQINPQFDFSETTTMGLD